MEESRTDDAPVVRSRASELLLFASNFLRDPYMLGSVIPSSRFLVGTVLAPIDWSRARVIVEYGPGVGTFTAEILRRMRSDARLIVIETNLDFVKYLVANCADHRLRVEHDSAENVQRILHRHAFEPRQLHRVGHSTRQHADFPAIEDFDREPGSARRRRRIPRLSIHEPGAAGVARNFPGCAVRIRNPQSSAGEDFRVFGRPERDPGMALPHCGS